MKGRQEKETPERPSDSITFVKPHRHRGVDYKPGDTIVVTPAERAKIVALGVTSESLNDI